MKKLALLCLGALARSLTFRNKCKAMLIAALALTAVVAWSREENAYNWEQDFVDYANYVHERFDITWKLPKGFHDQSRGFCYGFESCDTASRDGNAARFLPCAIQSDDRNCLVAYREMYAFDHIIQDNVACSIYNDDALLLYRIATGVLVHVRPDSVPYDERDYITPLSAKQLSKTNAEAGYVLKVPMAEVFRGKYSHCYVVTLGRAKQMSVEVCVFLSDEGDKQADKYLDLVLANIKYSNKQLENVRFNDTSELNHWANKYMKGRVYYFNALEKKKKERQRNELAREKHLQSKEPKYFK